VALDDLRVHRALAGDRGHVEDGALREAGRLEEAREAAELAHEPLLLDLLAQVGADVVAQVARRILGRARERQRPEAQRPREVEVAPELARRQRVHAQRARASGEQIRAPAPQLARARAGHREAQPAPLDQAVDLVEQLGHPLDLVQHDPAGVVLRDHLREPVRRGREALVGAGLQEVEDERVRELGAQPGRLARPARAEEEEAPPRRL